MHSRIHLIETQIITDERKILAEGSEVRLLLLNSQRWQSDSELIYDFDQRISKIDHKEKFLIHSLEGGANLERED